MQTIVYHIKLSKTSFNINKFQNLNCLFYLISEKKQFSIDLLKIKQVCTRINNMTNINQSKKIRCDTGTKHIFFILYKKCLWLDKFKKNCVA